MKPLREVLNFLSHFVGDREIRVLPVVPGRKCKMNVKSGELVDDDFGHGPFSSILFWGVILFLLLC